MMNCSKYSSRAQLKRFALCVVAVLSLLDPRPARADAPKVLTAQKDYRAAYDEIAKGHWSEARRLLLGLWADSKSYDVAASLGQVDFKLGHFGSSACFMAYALSNVAPSEKPAFVERLQAGLRELRPHVAALHVIVNEAGAEVALDGESLGTSPLASEVFVDPGKRVLTAQKHDRSAKAEINAEAGSSVDVRLELNQATSPALAPQPPAALKPAGTASTNVPPPGPAPSVLPVVVGGAVVVAAVVTGIALSVAADADYERAESLQSKNGVSGCATGSAAAADCKAQASANEEGDQNRNLSTLSFAIGGVALAATAAYWLWPRAPASAAARVRFQATASASSGFVGLSYDF